MLPWGYMVFSKTKLPREIFLSIFTHKTRANGSIGAAGGSHKNF
jgi:hypothetical protein